MHARSIAVIVNPQRRDALDELLASLANRSAVEVVEPDGADALSDAVRAAADRVDIVAAIGGDGTQRTAAEALKGTNTALAVVPGGTSNLFARVLGVGSVPDAARAIEHGRQRTIDTGIVDGETFVLHASTGYDAEVMRRVDDGAKRWGRLGYAVTGLRTLWSHRRHRVEVVVDGATFFSGSAMTVLITNVPQRGAADFMVARGGACDDGLLDVVVQRSDTTATMARALWALSRGRSPRDDDLLVGHGCSIDVHWSLPVAAQRDGDAVDAAADVHHRIDPGSLDVCVLVGD